MKITDLFKYTPPDNYNFNLSPVPYNHFKEDDSEKEIYSNIDLNLKYLKNKYNSLINSDILIREFSLTARNVRI